MSRIVLISGGIYYIISRSLGPEFGASVGIVFAFANAVSASMNTIGFCNSLNELLGKYNLSIIDGADTDVRIVGIIAVLIMVLICAVGMEWESKAQNLLIAIICGAILDFVVGTIIGPQSDEQKAKGFTGFSGKFVISILNFLYASIGLMHKKSIVIFFCEREKLSSPGKLSR